MTLSAPVRFMPTPPDLVDRMKTKTRGSVLKRCIIICSTHRTCQPALVCMHCPIGSIHREAAEPASHCPQRTEAEMMIACCMDIAPNGP